MYCTAVCYTLIAVTTVLLCGCNAKRRSHDYHSNVFITERDIDRSSVRVQTSKGVTRLLDFQLTKAGARRYTQLTALVAHEERRKKTHIYISFMVDGKAISTFTINYRVDPNGISVTPSTTIEIPFSNRKRLQTIARELRGR